MSELTTDAVTDAVTEAVEATVRVAHSAPVFLRIVLGLLMVALGAILWFVATVLLREYDRPRRGGSRRAVARS